MKSYPDWLDRIDAGHLVLKTGERFAISDGVSSKTFNEILEKPDIDDMFYVPYPIGTTPKQPAKNSDPGRVRFEPLFNAMYGDCKKNEVAKKLKIIDWLPNHSGGHVAVTTVNKVNCGCGIAGSSYGLRRSSRLGAAPPPASRLKAPLPNNCDEPRSVLAFPTVSTLLL